MGFFRSRSNKKSNKQQEAFVPTVGSYDNTSRVGNVDITKSKNDPTNKKSRLFVLSSQSKRSSTGSKTDVESSTPTLGNITMLNVQTPETISTSDSSSYTHKSKNTTPYTFTYESKTTPVTAGISSTESVLESLRIIPDNIDDDDSLKNYTYRSYEVMTPDSRKLMLEQREAIGKILFESNEVTEHAQNLSNNRLGDSYSGNNSDSFHDDLRASPPPPPPPLPPSYSSFPQNKEYIHSTAAYLSQEVTFDGVIQNASIDCDIEPNEQENNRRDTNTIQDISNEEYTVDENNASYDLLNSMDMSVNNADGNVNELQNMNVINSQGRTVPISVDHSYTESELASVYSKDSKQRGNSTINVMKGNANNEREINLDLQEKSHNMNQNNMQELNDSDYNDFVSEVAPTEAAVIFYEDGNPMKLLATKENKDVYIPGMMNISNNFDKSRSLTEEVSLQNARSAALRATENNDSIHNPGLPNRRTSSSPSPVRSQPDDEVDYDVNFTKKLNSSMPDDERKEYNKDEMIEMTRESSAGSTLIDIVDVRHRPLSLGGPSGLNNLESFEESTSQIQIISKSNDSIEKNSVNMEIPLDSDAHDEEIRYNQVVATDISYADKASNGLNNVGRGLSGKISTRSNINLMCNTADAKSLSKSILSAMNCVTGTIPECDENDIDKDNTLELNRQDVGIIYQKTDTMMSHGYCSLNASSANNPANMQIAKKTPTLFYTSNEDVTARFIRRVTKHGFALLYLQPPGCLGNPTEDWNGRTVTMTIEKGIIPKTGITNVNRLQHGLASSGNSVAFSTKSIDFTSTNNLTNSAIPIQHPRLQWMTVAGGLTTDVSTTSVDLFSIQAISASGNETDDANNRNVSTDSRTNHSLSIEEDFCCFTITTSEGIVHLFEATTVEERNRIVKGLKTIIARLSFHIIAGNPTSTSELYRSNNQSTSDSVSCLGKNSPKRHAQIDASLVSDKLPQDHSTVTLQPSSIPHALSELSKSDDEEPNDNDNFAYNGQGQITLPCNPNETMNRVAHIFLDV